MLCGATFAAWAAGERAAAGYMRVIFNCYVPFSLAHGGQQIQIEQTWSALEGLGVGVEPLRWWDANQRGDVLHQFGGIPTSLLQQAKLKGMKVVASAFLSSAGARPAWARRLRKAVRRALQVAGPRVISDAFAWDSFRLADACIGLTPFESRLLTEVFDAEPSRVRTIPNGVESVFLETRPEPRGPWLVCTATITELKQVLKLAEAAVAAQTSLWVIGRPFSESDDYARRFCDFARKHSNLIRYEGPITNRSELAGVYRRARGFVLLSQRESLSLSTLEAAACECPLLLSDLPWASEWFKDKASYCPASASVAATARVLAEFYQRAPALPPPPRPLSWPEVAQEVKQVYESVLQSGAS